MSWETFILLTYLKTAFLCQPLYKVSEPVCPFDQPFINTKYCRCIDTITDCVFDGDTFKECKENYYEARTSQR